MDSLNSTKDYWNKVHSTYERKDIIYDEWFDLFLTDIEACDMPIVDLGCGSGNDSKYLIEHGKKVVACDYSENAVENIRKNFPELIDVKCFDMTKGLPFEDGYAGIVIADLSLHYFSKNVTKQILKDIKRVLCDNGKLIFRVNSVNDVNHGAGQGKELEPHYYLNENNGRYKRYFDMDDINEFFKDWNIDYVSEEKMDRYELLKILWRAKVSKIDNK